MQWLVLVAIIVITGTALFIVQNPIRSPSGYEQFTDYFGSDVKKGPDGFVPELAEFGQGLPLADMLTPSTGLTNMSAVTCAAADKARQEELDGQYVQRTNNYKRDYPDTCSSLMSDFVGGFYKPKEGGVGITVPCDGQC